MKNYLALGALALMTMAACTKQPEKPIEVEFEMSKKLTEGYHNPLLDFVYTADPTAVEHEGRLYVYATNDQQQLDETHPDSANTYEKINSLVMMSTNDMVNWTYHGIIPTKKLAPWIIASWAPTVCSRVEDDGKTHFYLYFSNSGYGTGVLTATSPVGPWESPLDSSLVDAKTPGLGDCTVPFDPGVVIDDNGTGWIAFGAGKARIARLGKDMISFDSPFAVVPAPFHFEANELNIIGGKMVYTYNQDWSDKVGWKEKAELPTRCCMAYMLPGEDPLDTGAYRYQDIYLRNAGDDGFEYCNNHTHLHKYQGKWYVLHHTMTLKAMKGIKGGYRNVSVNEIQVDEDTQKIHLSHATHQGVEQIKPVDPTEWQQMETTFATARMGFEEQGDVPGNMVAVLQKTGAIAVKGVDMDKNPTKLCIAAQGEGQVDVRLDSIGGQLIASTLISRKQMGNTTTTLMHKPKGTHTLVFVMAGENLKVDAWQMK